MVTDATPLAWYYELATSIGGDGTYSRFDRRISFQEPSAPEGAMRNLTPLYATPAPSDGRYRLLDAGEVIEPGDECYIGTGVWSAGVAVDERAPDPGAFEPTRRYRRLKTATPAPSDQDASQAQGEGTVDKDRLYNAAENIAIAIGMGWDLDGVIDEMRAALSPAPGATAQDGVERAIAIGRELDAEDGGYPTPTIPAGMVAVPVVPTAQMIEAYRTCHAQPASKHPSGHGWARDTWSAMLAAAPKQAEQQGVEALRAALKPFLHVADPVVHNDRDRWNPDEWHYRLNHLTVGQFRALYAASLNAPTGAVDQQTKQDTDHVDD